MDQVFVIQNAAGQFLDRHGAWVGPEQAASLYRSTHRDLALNELFEATAKYSELRATVVAAPASSRGVPLVADLPPPDIPGTRAHDHEGEAAT